MGSRGFRLGDSGFSSRTDFLEKSRSIHAEGGWCMYFLLAEGVSL